MDESSSSSPDHAQPGPDRVTNEDLAPEPRSDLVEDADEGILVTGSATPQSADTPTSFNSASRRDSFDHRISAADGQKVSSKLSLANSDSSTSPLSSLIQSPNRALLHPTLGKRDRRKSESEGKWSLHQIEKHGVKRALRPASKLSSISSFASTSSEDHSVESRRQTNSQIPMPISVPNVDAAAALMTLALVGTVSNSRPRPKRSREDTNDEGKFVLENEYLESKRHQLRRPSDEGAKGSS